MPLSRNDSDSECCTSKRATVILVEHERPETRVIRHDYDEYCTWRVENIARCCIPAEKEDGEARVE
jgi:hypothetical protein